MATPRKKKDETEPPSETGTATVSSETIPSPGDPAVDVPPSDTNGSLTDAAPPAEGNAAAPAASGARRKPDQSYKLYSDRSTLLEVAIWENEVRYDDKVSLQHSIVLSRSYRNGEGKWVPSTTYRAYDLPLVRFLVDKAHAWCADRRTQDSSCPF